MGKRSGNIFSRQLRAKSPTIDENDHYNEGLNVKKTRLKNNMDASMKNRSLKRMKKKGVMQQVLGKFPKKQEKNPHQKSSPENVQIEMVKKQDSNQDQGIENEPEPIYESRKLLIRQMQGMIAKEVLKDRKGTVGSEYDSWSDLEENFARAYEPIPLNIKMETWRKMSKKEILKTVKSRAMRKEFEYMSHSEILGHIEKMHTSAKYLSNKFGVENLLQHNHPPLTRRQLERAKQKGRDVDLDSIVTNGQVLEEKINPVVEIQSQQQQQRKIHDSWSSRASSILKDPQSIYVSREEVLNNLKADILRAAPPPRGNAIRVDFLTKSEADGRSKACEHSFELRPLNCLFWGPCPKSKFSFLFFSKKNILKRQSTVLHQGTISSVANLLIEIST